MTLEQAISHVRAGNEIAAWLHATNDVYVGFLVAAAPIRIGGLQKIGPVELQGELIYQGTTAYQAQPGVDHQEHRVRLEFTPVDAFPPEPATARVVFHFRDGDDRRLRYPAVLTESPEGLCEHVGAGENAGFRLILWVALIRDGAMPVDPPIHEALQEEDKLDNLFIENDHK